MTNTKGGALPIKTIKQLLLNSYEKNPTTSTQDGYILDPTLSTNETQVYHNPHTQKAIVVHRGTQGMNDVFTDVAYSTTGYKGKRFKQAKKIQEEAERKYGAKNISTIGHSLGTLISNEVGKNSHEIINYNKPIVPYGKKHANEYNIKTTRDPFSFFKKGGKNTTEIKSKTLNPIHEHSINRLDNLDDELLIGHGIKSLQVKHLKAIIKGHNKRTKSKIRYGKMKKQELIQTVINLSL